MAKYAKPEDIIARLGNESRWSELFGGDVLAGAAHPNTTLVIEEASSMIEEALLRHFTSESVAELDEDNAPTLIRSHCVSLAIDIRTSGADVRPETFELAAKRADAWLKELRTAGPSPVLPEPLVLVSSAPSGATGSGFVYGKARQGGRVFDRNNANSDFATKFGKI